MGSTRVTRAADGVPPLVALSRAPLTVSSQRCDQSATILAANYSILRGMAAPGGSTAWRRAYRWRPDANGWACAPPFR